MTQQRISRLQHLRAYAALFVVIDHAILHCTKWTDQNNALKSLAYFLGDLGVWIFFIISGFIMMLISQKQFGKPGSVQRFSSQRIIRVIPLYWLITFLYIIKDHAYSGSEVIQSLLFIPYSPREGATAPILGQGWTLNFEFLFYLIFGLSLFSSLRAGIIMAFTAIIALTMMHPFIPASWTALHEWSRPITLLFLIGIGLSLLYSRLPSLRIKGSRQSYIALAAILLSAALTAIMTEHSSLNSSFLAALLGLIIVCAILFQEEPLSQKTINKLMEHAGNASYSTYLTHGLVLGALTKIWSKTINGEPLMFFITAVVLSLLFGQIIYHFIEQPLIKGIHYAREKMHGAQPNNGKAI